MKKKLNIKSKNHKFKVIIIKSITMVTLLLIVNLLIINDLPVLGKNYRLFPSDNIIRSSFITEDYFEKKQIIRIFNLIEVLNQEAAKQTENGNTKMAEFIENLIIRKTGISSEAKEKLINLSKNYTREKSVINNKLVKLLNLKIPNISEIKKMNSQELDRFKQERKSVFQRYSSEIQPLINEKNQLRDKYQNLIYKSFHRREIKKLESFIKEKILSSRNSSSIRSKNTSPFLIYNQNNLQFPKIAYQTSEPNVVNGGIEMYGYSLISYFDADRTVFGVSITDAECPYWYEDESPGCESASVDASLNLETLLLDGEFGYQYAWGDSHVTAEANVSAVAETSGEYCVDAYHEAWNYNYEIATANSSDCIDIDLSAGVEISSLEFEEIDSEITVNPGNGVYGTDIGWRIFPGYQNLYDQTDRSTVRVTAQVYPAISGIEIHFRSFDMDDPSSSDPDLDNENLTQDNRGDVNGKKEGRFDIDLLYTDSNGRASAEFTVTKQPGDNFAILAAKDGTQFNGVALDGMDLKKNGVVISTSPTTTSNPLIRTDLLTVWRKVHIEYDSMGVVSGNNIVGSFSSAQTIGSGETTLSISSTSALQVNRFQNGRMVVVTGNGQNPSFDVVTGTPQNPANTANTVRVINPGAALSVSSGQSFFLFDDDDFNRDDNPLNGDAGDFLPQPINDRAFLYETDIPPTSTATRDTNVLAKAYIRPVYDLPFSQESAGLTLNVEFNGQAIRDSFDFDNYNFRDDENFWAVYFLSGYQGDIDNDNDPNTELIHLGYSDGFRWGSVVFHEPSNPNECGAIDPFCSTDSTYAHEIGHLFTAEHNQGGLMDIDDINFSDLSLDFIRRANHP